MPSPVTNCHTHILNNRMQHFFSWHFVYICLGVGPDPTQDLRGRSRARLRGEFRSAFVRKTKNGRPKERQAMTNCHQTPATAAEVMFHKFVVTWGSRSARAVARAVPPRVSSICPKTKIVGRMATNDKPNQTAVTATAAVQAVVIQRSTKKKKNATQLFYTQLFYI